MRIRFKGVMTVEIAMIFPIIVFLLIALIIFGMMLCDVVNMNCVMDGLLEDMESFIFRDYDMETGEIDYEKQAESMIIKDVTNMAAGVFSNKTRSGEKYLFEKLEERMLVYEIEQVSVDVRCGRVYVTLKAKNKLANLPFIGVLKKEIKLEKSRLLTDECDVIRQAEILLCE